MIALAFQQQFSSKNVAQLIFQIVIHLHVVKM